MALNYKTLNESYSRLISDSVLSEKENRKLTQVKAFLDTSLKETLSKTFSTESEKINHLTQLLFQVRDYLFAENVENSLKQNLLKAFQQIEEDLKKVSEEEKSLEAPKEDEKKSLNTNIPSL